MIYLYSLLPILFILIIVALILFMTGVIVFCQTMGRHKKKEKQPVQNFFGDDLEGLSLFKNARQKEFIFRTKNRYNLKCLHLFSKEKNDKIVVLVHGLYTNMYEHSPHAVMFLQNGYDVFMYNQRSFGGSGGFYTSYGYYESRDLNDIIDLLKEREGYSQIIVNGFSMGGATSALHSEINEQKKYVDKYILDCAYSDMTDLFAYIAKRGSLKNIEKNKRNINKFVPFKLMLKLGDFMTRMFLHFGYKDVCPRDSVKKCSVPMLIIHAKDDITCPVYMGEEIFDSKIMGERDMLVTESTEHIKSYFRHKDRYTQKVIEFLQK